MGARFKRKRYIVTAAQSKARPHYEFLKSLETYNQEKKSETIILPMIGKNAREDLDGLAFDLQSDYDIELGTRKLNNNIQIEQFNIRPYQIDPIVGLNRFAQRETTLILASPKQRLKPVPHSNKEYAKYLVTTGACTMPNYATGDDVSAERRRLGGIARRDHEFGGLIVEVTSPEIFHMRHIKSNNNGEFVDLGIRYTPEGTRPAVLEAMVLGDYHNGATDPKIKTTTHKMIQELKPERLVLHDFFDAHSVCYHSDRKLIEEKLIQVVDIGHNILERELQEANDELCVLSELMEGRQIVVVASNHHEFLNKYLNEGMFMHDLTNIRLAFKLGFYMSKKDYNDPVVGGIKMMGRLPKNIKFLRRDQDFKVRGYQLGSHGDKGPGGGYGSVNAKENDFGKSISGHVHKAQKLRDTYTVGTMLPRNVFYARGHPSDWSHTHALLYDNASVQLINIINNKWKSR